mmetsp:Transcript_16902/g.57192  ORF Transcript_16902/g.57192 Transcript_16902/m.57192 type:complete len:246 (-) Transcript_16902:920-1657(-)
MRIMISSPSSFKWSSSARTRLIIVGMYRSASPTARPQSGSAGQAMARRASGSTRSMGRTSYFAINASSLGRSAGLILEMTMDCVGERIMSTPRSSTAWRRNERSLGPSGKSRMRPWSTWMPQKSVPSPASCHPIQSSYFHSFICRIGAREKPVYCSTSDLKLPMPMVWTRYLRRAFARTSRLPWSRCAATTALSTWGSSSAVAKQKGSAARAKVCSLPCVRPRPPPTTTLKPEPSSRTTTPMSLM